MVKDQSREMITEMTPREADEYTAGLIASKGEGLIGLEKDIFNRCQAMAQKRSHDEQEMQTWIQQAERLRYEIQVADNQIMALSGVLVFAENARRNYRASVQAVLEQRIDGEVDSKPDGPQNKEVHEGRV